jgi:signal transduction histidine kinase
MPPFFRSIRFKLSVQYSAVVFGLGGALLALVYIGLREMLRRDTMTHYVITGEPVYVDGELIGTVPALAEQELRTLESLFNEHVLEELARFTTIGLAVLFLLSLVVGWVMSGRFLRPIEEITDVAADIQASDLSRRINLEGPDDELTRLAATFDGMLERLDQAFTSQRQFLADTSHDLRTPLAVIRANVEVVLGDESSTLEDWRELGDIVARSSEKMAKMIDGLLGAARLQVGQAQAVSVDLAELVTSKGSEYGSLAEAHGARLDIRATAAIAQGVEVSLDRALTNLVDNAIAASKDEVVIGSGTVGDWAWMAVADDGPGLPDPPDGGRVGLGLAIVEQIVHVHGGALAHIPGSGTTMVIWLPSQAAPAGSHPDIDPFTDL